MRHSLRAGFAVVGILHRRHTQVSGINLQCFVRVNVCARNTRIAPRVQTDVAREQLRINKPGILAVATAAITTDTAAQIIRVGTRISQQLIQVGTRVAAQQVPAIGEVDLLLTLPGTARVYAGLNVDIFGGDIDTVLRLQVRAPDRRRGPRIDFDLVGHQVAGPALRIIFVDLSFERIDIELETDVEAVTPARSGGLTALLYQSGGSRGQGYRGERDVGLVKLPIIAQPIEAAFEVVDIGLLDESNPSARSCCKRLKASSCAASSLLYSS